MRVRATRLFSIGAGGRRPATSVFDGAEAAYSVRIPANSTYSGPINRVRRSNDNAELDIGAAGAQVALNRNFETASGWSLGTGVTYGTNQLVLVNAGIIAGQNMGLVTGRSYQFSIIVNKTGASPTSAMRISTGNSPTVETGPTTVIATNPPNGLNVFRAVITANGPCLVISADTNILSGSINFVSVQETNAIPGQDAWLNEYALLGHVTVNSGFVVTWYDQIGTRHYTNAIAAQQPRIVNAGVVDLLNSRPTILQNTQNQNLQNISGFTANINTVNAVLNTSASITSTAAFLSSASDAITLRRNVTQANGWRANTTFLQDFPSSTLSRINGAAAGNTSDGVANIANPLATNTVATFISNPSATINPQYLFISPSFATTRTFLGTCSEVVYFTDRISDSVRIPLEQNQGTAYGITVA